ncbi:MAG TPA: SCP2 sterol-binding domain-containing protein [Thermoplasmata archaeon]|jgi:putative sterol carrier protein
MVQYFSRAFFDELATKLNEDPEWTKKAGSLSFKLILTVLDRKNSILLDVQSGKVAAIETAADAPADFKFEANYDAWVVLGRAEKDFQSLVMGGKIKFRGSMPKVMGMMSQLNRITALAQQLPKEF